MTMAERLENADVHSVTAVDHRGESAFTSGLDAGIASHLFQIARACADCVSEDDFRALVRDHVRAVLPHRSLLAAVGSLEIAHLHIRRFVSVDHPAVHVESLAQNMRLEDRPVVSHWLQTGTPLVIQLPDDTERVSAFEASEIERFELGRLGVCGLVDIEARAGSYLSFAGLSERADKSLQLRVLRLLEAPLSQALVRCVRLATPKADSSFGLSDTECELLGWLVAGRTNAEIAALRGRSAATIRNQLHSAYRKLGVGSRVEALRLILNTPSVLRQRPGVPEWQ